MMLNCDACRVAMTRGRATIEHPYHFALSGLPNVYLFGIEIRSCPKCKHVAPIIPKMSQLTQAIAKALVEKATALTGDEIRYLRKFAGMQSKDFAAQLGVAAETYSRMESGKLAAKEATDKLVRIVAADAREMKEARQAALTPAAGVRSEAWEKLALQPTSRGWKKAA